jgi:2-polyprenyl-6-methoxyphenol hydroxylase-like FAD-dependent oxidoreductase
VAVEFTDGTIGRYDLVVGADGLHSAVRKAIFVGAPEPAYTGQGVWRGVIERPKDVDSVHMWHGPKIKIGINPVSRSEAYIFIMEDRPERRRPNEAEYVALFKKLLAPFSAPEVRAMSDQINERSLIVYRPLEALLLPRPWHRGRVVLIGDAVHATTPQLASGACIGMEDAIVLADEVSRARDVEAGLAAFEERRWERCRMVVENSLRLGEIERDDNGDKQEHADIMKASMMALAEPY